MYADTYVIRQARNLPLMERMSFPPGRSVLETILLGLPGWKAAVLATIRAQKEQLERGDQLIGHTGERHAARQNAAAPTADEVVVLRATDQRLGE